MAPRIPSTFQSSIHPTTRAVEKLSRLRTMTLKKVKRLFGDEERSDPFLKTIKILSSQIDTYVEYKMRLDTGCEKHNLITLKAVEKLKKSQDISICYQSICTCLNGEPLVSTGTLSLCWKGKSFRKIFDTLFHVIDGDLPWDVILGAETIHQHGILKVAGFAGACLILPKLTKEQKAQLAERKRERDEKAAENAARVAADIKAKEEAARQSKL